MAINSLSASSYGLSGLVSGMDTQSMVEKMLSGTQLKIDKAGQKKSVLQYKQSMYREVIAKLNTLQTSFLSFTSGTNLLSSAFYNSMTTSIKTPTGVSAAFSVSASSSAQVGNVSVDYIQQLATAKSSKTTAAATGAVGGTMNQAVAQKIVEGYTGDKATLKIKIGDTTVDIEEAATTFAGKTPSEVAAIINDKLGGLGEARFANNKLQIIATNPEDSITISGNDEFASLPMQMFGTRSSLYSNSGTLSAAIDTDLYKPSFTMNLDGRQQTIYMDLNALNDYANAADNAAAEGALGRLLDGINDSLQRNFGTGVKATGVIANGNMSISFASGNNSQKFTITGTSEVMSLMGMKSGISNKINTNTAIKDLNFASQLQGDKHTFKINGVEFSYDSGATLGTVINDINNSKAGVKVSYIESEDRFMIQNSQTGETTTEFDIQQTEGNLMSVIFGAAGGSDFTGQGINMEMKGGSVALKDIQLGGNFTFNVNGKDYTLNVPWTVTDPFLNHATFAEAMNKKFASAFGRQADGTQTVEFKLNAAGDGFDIVSNNPNTVVKTVAQDDKTNKSLLGFAAGQSTRATSGDFSLADAGIKFGSGSMSINLGDYGTLNLSGADLDGQTDINAVVDFINQKIDDHIASAVANSGGTLTAPAQNPGISFDEKTAAFRIAGMDIPMEIVIAAGSDSENLNNMFGQTSISLSTADQGILAEHTKGRNAIVSINGTRIERDSNNFTYEGLSFTLNSTTHIDPKDTEAEGADVDLTKHNAASQVAVSRDTQKIVDGIQEFLKLYNETIDFINGFVKADATYKEYAPLTSAQKAEMSEREIEQWEEKSKEGLLRNDSALNSVLQSLRSAMNTRPESSSMALYDLGISTSFYTNAGNFNAESTESLLAAIEKDPEAVRQLFAGDGGVMEVLNKAIDGAVKSSYGGSGSLVSVAGTSSLDTSSSIYKQIKAVDTQLTNLENSYWTQYNRYWKQFNSMEQMISNMNTQSSWLSQQFA